MGDRTTPERPALMPALGWGKNRQRQSNPLPPAPGAPRPTTDEGRRTNPPPPPTRLTHRRPPRPRPAPGAAKHRRLSTRRGGTRGSMPPAKRGGLGRGLQATPPQPPRVRPGNQRVLARNPPRPSPPRFPRSGSREAGGEARGCRPSNPRKGQGSPPPPPRRATAAMRERH